MIVIMNIIINIDKLHHEFIKLNKYQIIKKYKLSKQIDSLLISLSKYSIFELYNTLLIHSTTNYIYGFKNDKFNINILYKDICLISNDDYLIEYYSDSRFFVSSAEKNDNSISFTINKKITNIPENINDVWEPLKLDLIDLVIDYFKSTLCENKYNCIL